MAILFRFLKVHYRTCVKVSAASQDPTPSGTELNTTQRTNVLKKMANGSPLTPEESRFARELNLSELALLSINNQTSEEFSRLDFEPGTVLKVTLFLKDTNSVVSASSVLTVQEVAQRNNNLNLNFLNYYTFSVDMFYIIAENNKSISWQSLIEFFHNKFYMECISWLYPDSVILESISFSRVYPMVDRNHSRSMAFGTPGRLPSRTNPASEKPYIFTLISNFVFSQRNAFTIRLPKMSQNTSTYASRNSGVPSEFIYKTASFLENPIFIGPAGAFALKLSVKTLKEDSPIKYFPADRALPLGFLSPVLKTSPTDYSFPSKNQYTSGEENSASPQADRGSLTPEELNAVEQDFIEAESTDLPEEERKRRGRPEGSKDTKPRSRRSSPKDSSGMVLPDLEGKKETSSDDPESRPEPTLGGSNEGNEGINQPPST